MFYAAAALPEALWERLSVVAADVADTSDPADRVVGVHGDRPGATAHFASARCGCIGVPLPGVTLKLVPQGDKHEIADRPQCHARLPR
jgi:feruloyl-CoA synthase